MLKDMQYEELYVQGIKDLFLVANIESNPLLHNNYSWEQATLKYYEILEKYNEIY